MKGGIKSMNLQKKTFSYIMAFMLTLEFKSRDIKENLNKIRTSGFVPAVFYGRKEESTPISVSSVAFGKVWKEAGESSVIHLKSGKIEHDALIQEIYRDPVKGTIKHADFYVIEKGKKLKVKVPIDFIGVSPAVKDFGGILVKVVHALEVEALPKDLPHRVTVDISSLVTFENVITAKEIKLGEGVTLIIKPDDVIASVYEPKEEVEEVAPVDLSAIEVEKKGKEPKEGEDVEGAGSASAKDAKVAPAKK